MSSRLEKMTALQEAVASTKQTPHEQLSRLNEDEKAISLQQKYQELTDQLDIKSFQAEQTSTPEQNEWAYLHAVQHLDQAILTNAQELKTSGLNLLDQLQLLVQEAKATKSHRRCSPTRYEFNNSTQPEHAWNEVSSTNKPTIICFFSDGAFDNPFKTVSLYNPNVRAVIFTTPMWAEANVAQKHANSFRTRILESALYNSDLDYKELKRIDKVIRTIAGQGLGFMPLLPGRQRIGNNRTKFDVETNHSKSHDIVSKLLFSLSFCKHFCVKTITKMNLLERPDLKSVQYQTMGYTFH